MGGPWVSSFPMDLCGRSKEGLSDAASSILEEILGREWSRGWSPRPGRWSGILMICLEWKTRPGWSSTTSLTCLASTWCGAWSPVEGSPTTTQLCKRWFASSTASPWIPWLGLWWVNQYRVTRVFFTFWRLLGVFWHFLGWSSISQVGSSFSWNVPADSEKHEPVPRENGGVGEGGEGQLQRWGGGVDNIEVGSEKGEDHW